MDTELIIVVFYNVFFLFHIYHYTSQAIISVKKNKIINLLLETVKFIRFLEISDIENKKLTFSLNRLIFKCC